MLLWPPANASSYRLPITSRGCPDDPKTRDMIAGDETRLGTALDAIVGTTRVPLDGINTRLRSSETNLGDLVADALRADADADIAIGNSGSIRGNRIFPAGPLTRRTLVESQREPTRSPSPITLSKKAMATRCSQASRCGSRRRRAA